jgi:heme/copper-type cytochrome/quinol oxidase subunit 3
MQAEVAEKSTLIHEKTKLLMLLFIASETIFFAFLITAFVFYHGAVKDMGPKPSRSLDPFKTGMFSIALFASSATMWLTTKALREKRDRGMKLWLAVTAALGAVFLVGQGREYAHMIGQNITVRTNLFGTTFFTLTGFHGLHVFIGLILLLIVLGLAAFGDGFLYGKQREGFEAVSYYWHFVDVVWVAIYTIVYLWATR